MLCIDHYQALSPSKGFLPANAIYSQCLLAVARNRGVRIPEDVAIIGFDDLLIAQFSTPALTKIRQPLKEMAEIAYKIAVVHRYELLRKSQNVISRHQIVIRKSA